jgi:hypothetical protein
MTRPVMHPGLPRRPDPGSHPRPFLLDQLGHLPLDGPQAEPARRQPFIG